MQIESVQLFMQQPKYADTQAVWVRHLSICARFSCCTVHGTSLAFHHHSAVDCVTHAIIPLEATHAAR